jgi:trk system potassium uptake protein TrkH
MPAALVLVYGFAVMIAIGTLLLLLPIANQARELTPFLTALFTATSAVCVTGLAVVDTGTYWSGFGQVVILLLVQAGGFGFMTSSTLLLFLAVGRRTGLRDRVLMQEATGTTQLGNVVALVRRIALFTLILEAAGALVLTIGFLLHGEAGTTSLWWGIFHSVSAFNNGGFDLTGDFRSLSGFASEWLILGTLGILIVVGGLGFAIVDDVAGKRRWVRFALETKVVLLTTVALILVGLGAILIFEWGNPATLGALPVEQRPLNALFESITLRTAGFSVLPTGQLRDASLFVVMALMFIGGASGSTAGGIKVNTFGVLLIAIISTARGLPSAVAFGRRIQHAIVYRAMSVALLSIAFVFLVGLGLELLAPTDFVGALFESVSAAGTVGATTGLTPQLGVPAQLLVIVAMFVGRLGPLTLALALAARERSVAFRPAVETIRIG